MVGQLRYICVETGDIPEAKAFYTWTLGLHIKEEGESWFTLEAGALSVIVWQGPTHGTLMGFVEPELEAAHNRLKAQGADVGEISPNPGGRHFYVTGPDDTQVIVFDD